MVQYPRNRENLKSHQVKLYVGVSRMRCLDGNITWLLYALKDEVTWDGLQELVIYRKGW